MKNDENKENDNNLNEDVEITEKNIELKDDSKDQTDSDKFDEQSADNDKKPQKNLDNEQTTEESFDEMTENKPDSSLSDTDEIDISKSVGEAMEESSKRDLTDEEIDKVVDDIVRTESDEAIAEADAKIEALKQKKEKLTFKHKVANYFRAWWENKPIRYGTFAAFGLLLVVIALLPTTRYTMLNIFGVRVGTSMTVIDSQTRLPLKNINVSLQDKTQATNEDGYVEFTDLKLGKSQLLISKIGYADNDREIVLGWGSNPIGNQELIATGEQFTFILSDWQSGEKITTAEANAGENSAKADDTGKIVLTVGQENISDVEVVISAENYRDEVLGSSQLSDDEIDIKLVPAKKHVFVSNRSGEFDLYKIDVDQKNEEILLGSTGKEREVPTVLTHPTRNLTAFVSSRDGDENSDGFILDGLFLIDVESGDTNRIARSEQLQLLGWSGDNLIFWQVVEGTSRANPERSKIISYNERTSERTELAAANYFNDIELIDDTVYYAVSSYAVPQSQAKLYSINIDGTGKQELINKQVWSIFRTVYNKLLFNTEDQKWYEKELDQEVQEVGQQPAPQGYKYVDSPNGEKTAWVEVRDGKGVLLLSDTSEINEEQILTLPGVNEVLYWLNDTSLVFRLITNTETADYIVDITKKEPIKITDVTATQNRYF